MDVISFIGAKAPFKWIFLMDIQKELNDLIWNLVWAEIALT